MLERDDIGTEPTELASFSFGHTTMPLWQPSPEKPIVAGSFVEPFPRIPTPVSNTESIPAPMIAPPSSAKRGLVLGFAIGTSLGLAVLGAAWHFFL